MNRIMLWRDTISAIHRRMVLGFEGGGGKYAKAEFFGNLPNTIRNNILKLPVIPAGAFSIIQDGVQRWPPKCPPKC